MNSISLQKPGSSCQCLHWGDQFCLLIGKKCHQPLDPDHPGGGKAPPGMGDKLVVNMPRAKIIDQKITGFQLPKLRLGEWMFECLYFPVHAHSDAPTPRFVHYETITFL